jgi:hypothetical protein
VFNKDIQSLCARAISQFLNETAQCAFIDPDNGERCINTYMGHAQGHQSGDWKLLKGGLFMSDNFDSQGFLTIVETAVHAIMFNINAKAPSSRRQWRRYAAEVHRENIAELRLLKGSLCMSKGMIEHDIRSTTVCYGCFFGRPEYQLPCNHVICEYCIKDFDETPKEDQYPGWATHHSCIICEASDSGWPYRIPLKPDLARVRVLSLDGGGIRGIVELTILQRLENLIDLGIPLGQFFDLMVGTSAGRGLGHFE